MLSVLHAGCGRSPCPAWLSGFAETRLDIDPTVQPDVVASLTDMGEIGPFDVIYTCHTLEHLFPHEVPRALAEFHRVLKPGGKVVAVVPDLQDVQPTEEVLYVSAAGPITGRDMYYGMASLVEASPYMAHRTGFVSATFQKAFQDAGFAKAMTMRIEVFNILAVAIR